MPPLKRILEADGALGTDNVINSPDMFREMGFAYKILSTRGSYGDVAAVLRAATVKLRPLLGLGPVAVGEKANFVLLDVEPSWNLHPAIVNRAQRDCVRLVV